MKLALVVEDITDVRQWLCRNLREAFPRIECVEAATCAEAMDAIERAAFELALIDLSLPDGSGLDIIAHLRGHAPQTVTVVATIHDDDAHLFNALKSGARGYLLKDMRPQRFVKSLRGLLDGEPPLSPSIAARLIEYFSAKVDERYKLTAREREVLTLLAKGARVPEVADMLALSSHTVSGYVKDIYRKLDVTSRAEATLKAHDLGLL